MNISERSIRRQQLIQALTKAKNGYEAIALVVQHGFSLRKKPVDSIRKFVRTECGDIHYGE